MSSHDRSDFPPHWDPPPRVGYREPTPNIMDVMAHLDVLPQQQWVKEVYAAKFANALRGETEELGVWWELPAEEVERRVAILERLPNKNEIVKETSHGLEMIEQQLPKELQERVEKLLKESGCREPMGE